MSRDVLIRFVTTGRHPPYGHRTGIFSTAYAIRRNNELAEPAHTELIQLLDWFNDNLAKPARFTRSKYPRAQNSGISWIKSSATEHVLKLRRLVAFVKLAGYRVDELETDRPGYIVFEDDEQVVALPFADTPR